MSRLLLAREQQADVTIVPRLLQAVVLVVEPRLALVQLLRVVVEDLPLLLDLALRLVVQLSLPLVENLANALEHRTDLAVEIALDAV